MPAENKGLKIAIFFILTLVISLAGCRLLDPHSSFDYGSESAAPVSSLSGTVLVKPGDLTSIRGNRNPARTSLLAADLSGLVSVAGAEVWIEELPDVAHQITDQDGKYTFKDLPPGNFRIVSAFKKADNNVMKVRSEPVEIVSAAETATASAIVLAPANKEVSGILRDENGEFIPAGTMLILWGEKFYVEAEGRFTSPPLPDDVEMADKIVANTTLYAKWVPEAVGSFMVTFDAQSGSAVDAQLIASGALAVEPVAPVLAGFAFTGWYKEPGLINLWDFKADKVGSNIVLYAGWVSILPDQFTLTYTAGPGGAISGISPQTVTADGSGTPVLAVPAAGFVFLSWSDGRTDNPRTDINPVDNLAVIAIFLEMAAKIPGEDKYAYSESAGWINFATTQGNVFAKIGTNGCLSGMAWSENLGWIKFAATAATAPYSNTSATDWGVNMAADGRLPGYAWSESSGWITFSADTAAVNLQTGAMSGFAWSENIGWISLSGSSYGVRFVL